MRTDTTKPHATGSVSPAPADIFYAGGDIEAEQFAILKYRVMRCGIPMTDPMDPSSAKVWADRLNEAYRDGYADGFSKGRQEGRNERDRD